MGVYCYAARKLSGAPYTIAPNSLQSIKCLNGNYKDVTVECSNNGQFHIHSSVDVAFTFHGCQPMFEMTTASYPIVISQTNVATLKVTTLNKPITLQPSSSYIDIVLDGTTSFPEPLFNLVTHVTTKVCFTVSTVPSSLEIPSNDLLDFVVLRVPDGILKSCEDTMKGSSIICVPETQTCKSVQNPLQLAGLEVPPTAHLAAPVTAIGAVVGAIACVAGLTVAAAVMATRKTRAVL